MRLILASGSPRRRELLEAAGLHFEVIPSPAEEIHDATLGMEALCETNARLKARAVAAQHPGAVVIGADTLVFLDGVPLGKPKDMEEAAAMLRSLSGFVHDVCTGVCICGPGEGEEVCLNDITEVVFRKLDEPVIGEYLRITNPLDKAGAYGIQDHGGIIVERIVGSYENVMGLPVEAVLDALAGIGLLMPPG